ncbi:hypothetical protein, variant [Sphaeroforma arctica JP610]|uniref:Thioredoxin domain-containing protein n=1 Tax=Sphaeroforma arctica JP610 TaxID=667725 RepID=A0A0L0FY15_9EUKA|nr:hypothetical protein, variant [Sphaeroforma arctica JP610]KNC80853.1 hypothetical protein, variant [Sphaeroforma arctica JP610]|eukprot:XP_014154755.1 hypothetical protein, variant [Sphaeroforma arctica JP610]
MNLRKFSAIALASLVHCVTAEEIQAVGGAEPAVQAHGPVDLNAENFQQHLDKYEYTLVAFGAPWCPYSNALQPVLAQLSQVTQEQTNFAVGRVNCDDQKAVCQHNQITKYPTIKFIQEGITRPQEYRSARTVGALQTYIKKEMEPVVAPLGNLDVDTHLAENKAKKVVIAKFRHGRDTGDFKAFDNMAKTLRGHCQFYHTDQDHHFEGAVGNRLIVLKKHDDHEMYPDQNPDAEVLDDTTTAHLNEWLQAQCKPLIDELTFENSEALVEEGKPLMILFTKPDDSESREIFKKAVRDLVAHEASRVKFLVADGTQFKHPLQHISKTMDDLPVLAVDSFKHMYDFGDFRDLQHSGRIQTFINNLFNNQLHERFHHGDMTAKTCMWRQTGGCIADGPREVHADKKCDAVLDAKTSGFCECGVEHFGVVLRMDCGHEKTTCEEKCQKAHEDSRNERLAQCMFKQTAKCDPDGPAEVNEDKDCLTIIHHGTSGRCECSPTGPVLKYTCKHDHFTCKDVCMKEMARLEHEITGDIKEGLAVDKALTGNAHEYQKGLVEDMKKNHAEAAAASEKQNNAQRAMDAEPEGESQFEKLGPSKRRYSFVGNRDEL